MTQVTVFIGDPQKVIWSHLSSTVFLRITFYSEEIKTWEWSHCVSLIKTHRVMQYDLLESPRDLDMRSNFDLDLSRSYYTCFDASWGKHDGFKIIALSLQTRKLSKNGFAQKCRFLTFRDLTPKRLILVEIWGHVSERAFQELSSAFLNFNVALTGVEIMLIIWSHAMSDHQRKFGKILPLMTYGDLSFDRT